MENKKESIHEQLGRFVGQRIGTIQGSYLSSNRSKGARQLAALRHAVNNQPGETASIWQLEFDGLPYNLLGKGDVPSKAERAVHAALTLYALHQRSQTIPMHQSGREYGLGQAMHKLVLQNESSYKNLAQGEFPRRFAAFVTADSFEESMYYARQLIGQLRSASIPLDYALLACQLYDIQIPERAEKAKLAWGRGFAYTFAPE